MITLKNIASSAVSAWATALFFINSAQAGIPVEHWKQTNGVQIYLVHSPAIPMLDVQIDFDAGSRRDPAQQAGLANVTANMLSKGLRADPVTREIPVVLLSAYEDSVMTLRAAKSGARAYLKETGRSRELVDALALLTAPRRKLREALATQREFDVELISVGMPVAPRSRSRSPVALANGVRPRGLPPLQLALPAADSETAKTFYLNMAEQFTTFNPRSGLGV